MLGLKVDLLINLLCREDVVSNGDVVYKNRLELVSLSAKNLVFLKSLKVINGQVSDNRFGSLIGGVLRLALFNRELCNLLSDLLHRCFRVCSSLLGSLWLCFLRSLFFEFLLLSVDEFYIVCVDDTVTLTLNFKVVGNQVNGATGNERVWVA